MERSGREGLEEGEDFGTPASEEASVRKGNLKRSSSKAKTPLRGNGALLTAAKLSHTFAKF